MASSTSKADIRDDVPPSKEQDNEDAEISPEPQESEQSGIEGTEETGDGNSGSTTVTMEDRKARLDKLRAKMRTSTKANRQSLIEESARAKLTVRDMARLERQKKLAEMLRTQAEAEGRGEDIERSKNWEWTIEENEKWEKKLARKARRADFEFHGASLVGYFKQLTDDAHAAHRRYKKDLDFIKPNLEAYNKQREQALGLTAGVLSESGSSTPSGSSNALTTFDPSGGRMVPTTEQRMAVDAFYRDANTLLYGDNKPSEEAVDRLISKLNHDVDKKAKFSRKRHNEDEGDITYINERNRVFNKKIARYYDKYTAEIRASFERGTAL
ncbi:SYF2-domain-containing protein [Pisolithus orientalis]|uniref:SYF2-domain-containing protein n=1 Tax=Pisolithus orientalis TaxID=936130 RepID=UPI002224FCA6|nr:SYF2-domain-containing protein [Pisolithus orientalis]KAI5990296.1 SYF2-domain-containing protein [Pisolithus orientalis]